jgi:ribonuclease BN (tRNA processing enzyme)
MKISIIFLTDRSIDSYPSVAVVIGGQAVLINVPEGYTRHFLDSTLSSVHIPALCLTSTLPSHSGGLMLLSLKHSLKNTSFLAPSSFPNGICLNSLQNPILSRSFSSPTFKVSSIQLSNSLSFKIDFQKFPPIFSPDKAQNIGVPHGHCYKELIHGEAILLENGNKVTFKKVSIEVPDLPSIYVIDCTQMNDLHSFHVPKGDICIHLTEPKLFSQPVYQNHFSNNLNICFPFVGIDSFPQAVEIAKSHHVTFPVKNYFIKEIPNFHFASSKTIVNLFPKFSLDNSYKFEAVSPIHKSISLPKTYSLTVLGSGKDIIPQRSTTSFLLHTPFGRILLDSGENALGGIKKVFGSSDVLQNLVCIWISHHHVDHILGLASILHEYSKIGRKKIPLFIPKEVHNLIKNSTGFDEFKVEPHDRPDVYEFEGIKIESFDVNHVSDSKGCKITIDNQYIVVFSGDRNPDRILESRVPRCDLLIHEASVPYFYRKSQEKMSHSTIMEAIDSGKQMNAKNVLLTHLLHPIMTNEIIHEYENVYFSYDYMTFGEDL